MSKNMEVRGLKACQMEVNVIFKGRIFIGWWEKTAVLGIVGGQEEGEKS